MPTRSHARLLLSAVAAATFAVAAPAVLAADRDVRMQDFAFAPGSVEIRVGDTVTWTNRDSVEHTATARNGSFDTGMLAEGASGSIRFTVAGTYRYLCTPHPDMTGTIVVRPASGGVTPPNTETAPAAPGAGGGSVGLAAVLGGLAFIVAYRRVWAARSETTDRRET